MSRFISKYKLGQMSLIFLTLMTVTFPSLAAIDVKSCRVDKDCMLVQESWCQEVLAISKKQENYWQKKNQKNYRLAQKQKQTCKTIPAERAFLKNYKAQCIQAKCQAVFVKK